MHRALNYSSNLKKIIFKNHELRLYKWQKKLQNSMATPIELQRREKFW